MKPFLKMTWVDLKLYLRSWQAAFFTLVFPVLMLVLFGTLYGNEPSPLLGGYGTIDVGLPGYIAGMLMGTTAFMSLPGELAYRRQAGILRRLRATPLQPMVVLISQVLVNWLMTVAGSLVLIVTMIALYNPQLPRSPGLVGAAFVIGSLSQLALGFVLASIMPSASAARAVGMAVFYPMMFLAGGTFPPGMMPESLRRLADLMPLHYAVNLLQKAWLYSTWDTQAMLVLLVLLVGGVLLSVRTFRWE